MHLPHKRWGVPLIFYPEYHQSVLLRYFNPVLKQPCNILFPHRMIMPCSWLDPCNTITQDYIHTPGNNFSHVHKTWFFFCICRYLTKHNLPPSLLAITLQIYNVSPRWHLQIMSIFSCRERAGDIGGYIVLRLPPLLPWPQTTKSCVSVNNEGFWQSWNGRISCHFQPASIANLWPAYSTLQDHFTNE